MSSTPSREQSDGHAPKFAQETSDARIQLQATARLLSHLLLHEIDDDLVGELEQLGAKEALSELGISLPRADDKAAMDDLSVAYFERFVNPAVGAPPIQSLAEEGKYSGRAFESMEKIAIAAGLTFASDAVRGAPVDHLGSQLSMWAELSERDPATATEFAQRHLTWSVRALSMGSPTGFYGSLSRVVVEFIRSLDH